MEEKNAVIEDAQTKDLASKNGDSADELLQKISEVVKDENSPSKAIEDDLSKSSDNIFLKKIEEIENEISDISKVMKKKISDPSETVVVGDLVIKIDTDVSSMKDIENIEITDKKDENTDNSRQIILEDSIELQTKKQSENIEENKSGLINKLNIIEPMSIETSNNVEQMEVDSIEKRDEMDVDSSECSLKGDFDIKNNSPKNAKEILEISNIEKIKINTSISEHVNLANKLDNEKTVLPTILQSITETVQQNKSINENETKKNKLIENGGEKSIDIPCTTKKDTESLSVENKCSTTTENHTEADVEIVQNCVPQNKLINKDIKNEDLKTNLNSTPISSTSVFNKKLDISSENISTISEAETSQIKKTNDEKSKNEDSTTETETNYGTCTFTKSELKTTDGSDKNVQLCKNGIRNTTTDEEDEISSKNIKESEKVHKNDLPICITTKSKLETKLEESYEVNFISDENQIKYFFIENIDLTKRNSNVLLEKTTSISSDQFTLPTKSTSHLSEISSATSISDSQKTFIAPLQSPKNIAFKNTIELCSFVIDHFTKIKKNIEPNDLNNTTTMTQNLNKTPDATSIVISNKASRKRSLNVTQSEDENEEITKSKQLKKDTTPIKKNDESSEYGECVLAKWIDKKYYAGRITGEKPGNKFVVLFEDGASKTLSKDAIVFGEDRILPLKDQSVFTLVDEDGYERGIVVSIEKTHDKVYYTVKTDNKTVVVTASDLYLQENQAKIVQKAGNPNKLTEEIQSEIVSNNGRSTRNKRSHNSPVTPEAGFSGSTTKGSKRQKRQQQRKPKSLPQRNRYESTSEISDTPDESPVSQQLHSELALEAIEGVQPEVQKTDSESEICKMMFLIDLESLDKNIAVQDMIESLPTVRNIFRNKYFILTCTVGLKPHRYEQTKLFGENYKNRQFSKVPFVKTDLRKQIIAGGGVVYEHFEDIPANKYRLCKLIVSRPCITAKYIQCLSANIQAVSHEWIIDSCSNNRLLNNNDYVLPAGWSITKEIFIKWLIGKSHDKRESKKPFTKQYILLAAQHKDFIDFWYRVCKLAGAEVRLIKSLNDITSSTKGYLIADMDFPQVIRSKAEHFGIQIVSTVWIVESLILGKLCAVNNNRKLRETFQDDD